MINEQETLLFIKELGRLLKDYQNCSNTSVKSEIYKDIVLLSNVIQLDHVERFLRLENPFYFFINFSFSTITTEKEEKRRFPSISFLPFLVLSYFYGYLEHSFIKITVEFFECLRIQLFHLPADKVLVEKLLPL